MLKDAKYSWVILVFVNTFVFLIFQALSKLRIEIVYIYIGFFSHGMYRLRCIYYCLNYVITSPHGRDFMFIWIIHTYTYTCILNTCV